MSDSNHPEPWWRPTNPNPNVKFVNLNHERMKALAVDAPEEYEAYLNHLQEAERSLAKALDCLYKHDGVRRGVGYRIRLGRAQSIAMTLLVREINHKEGYKSGGAHEWELVGTQWECVYCERRVDPKLFGRKLLFFGPDIYRRIPVYGRKWRCDG